MHSQFGSEKKKNEKYLQAVKGVISFFCVVFDSVLCMNSLSPC